LKHNNRRREEKIEFRVCEGKKSTLLMLLFYYYYYSAAAMGENRAMIINRVRKN